MWGGAPNRWVEEVCAPLPPGRALDLACGEGRNALWLAGRGWHVTGVDFSRVALDRAAELARTRAPATGSLAWRQADVTRYEPEPSAYDLALLCYLHLTAEPRRRALRAAARALRPGGLLLVVAHHSDNLAEGVGGPQDPAVLYTAEDVVEDLSSTTTPDGTSAGQALTYPVVPLRAERVHRAVTVGEERATALDTLFLAWRQG